MSRPQPLRTQIEVARPFRLLGFATGDYMCVCRTCEITFLGDKRAVTCLPCAAERVEELAETQAETKKVLDEAIELLSAIRSGRASAQWEGVADVLRRALKLPLKKVT